MTASFSIATFLSLSLLSRLTQSTSDEACLERKWHIQSCVHSWEVGSLDDKVHLSHIIELMVNPGSVLILTDCVTEFIYGDFRLFSSLFVAIVNGSLLEKINPIIFYERKPFIVIYLPEESTQIAVKQIYDSYQLPSREVYNWLPTILIIRKELTTSKREQSQVAERTFTDIQLHTDSTLYIIFPEIECSSLPPTQQTSVLELAIWEAYGIKKSRIFSELSTLQVSLQTGAYDGDLVSLESFGKRRKNFNLEEFAASIKIDPFLDWVKLEKVDNNSYIIVGGGEYVSFIYKDLRTFMNFSVRILMGDSPNALQNGSVVGITAEQLRSGMADVTLNVVSFSIHRAESFTFLQPTYHSVVHIFFKQPTQGSIRDIVISAFTKELWLTLIGVWAILVMAMKLRPLLLPAQTSPLEVFPFLEYVTNRDLAFSKESALWSVAALCQKTWYSDPESISLRLKFLIGSLASLILYTAYSASITSGLAVTLIPVKSFEDLINFKYVFTVHNMSEPFQALLKGLIEWYDLSQDIVKIPTEKEISHLYTGNDPFTLKSSRKAFLSPEDMFYKTAETFNYTNRFMCDHISTLQAGTYLLKSAMLVKKASEFKEIVNYSLVYLRARGLIHRNVLSYNTNNYMRCLPIDQRGSTVDPAEFSDVFTVLLALFVGLPLAVLILLLEMAFSRGCQAAYKSRKVSNKAREQIYFDDIIQTFYLA